MLHLFVGCFISPCYRCLLCIHCELIRLWQLISFVDKVPTSLLLVGFNQYTRFFFFCIAVLYTSHQDIRETFLLGTDSIHVFARSKHHHVCCYIPQIRVTNLLIATQQPTPFLWMSTVPCMTLKSFISIVLEETRFIIPETRTLESQDQVCNVLAHVLQYGGGQPLQKYWVAFNQGSGGWIWLTLMSVRRRGHHTVNCQQHRKAESCVICIFTVIAHKNVKAH